MTDIPDGDNLSRYVNPFYVDTGGKIQPEAFQRKIKRDDKIEEFLSCAWLEYFKSNFEDNVFQSAHAIKKILKSANESGKLAVFNCGIIRNHPELKSSEIKIAQISNDSHAGVFNNNDLLVAEIIAENVSCLPFPRI